MALPGKPISVTIQNPTKKKQLSDLKKSKIFVGNKNVEIFKETLYHHLDIANTCSTEKIQSQIGLYKSKAQLPTEKADYDLIKDILSDPVRRAMYDLGKIDKLHGTSGIPGRTHHAPGFHETARETLGDRNLARMPEIWNNVIVKAKDVRHALKCTLEEFYNGKTVKLKIQRQQICSTCKGIGMVASPANQPGFINSTKMGGGGIPCPTCQGRKVERCPNELEFKIEPGVRNGFRKKLKGQGDNPPNMLPADIYLIVEQKPHDTYIRYGSDLVTTITVSLEEHLVGCVRHLRHLKELDRASKTFQVLKVKIPPLKKKFVIPGKGMPKYIKKTSIVEIPVEYGDLVVNVCVNYPEKVNEAQIEVLSKFLPPPSVMEVENTDLNVTQETVQLENLIRIGSDQVDNSKDDKDKISDGVDKCPVS